MKSNQESSQDFFPASPDAKKENVQATEGKGT